MVILRYLIDGKELTQTFAFKSDALYKAKMATKNYPGRFIFIDIQEETTRSILVDKKDFDRRLDSD
jgi:hypothetical protein